MAKVHSRTAGGGYKTPIKPEGVRLDTVEIRAAAWHILILVSGWLKSLRPSFCETRMSEAAVGATSRPSTLHKPPQPQPARYPHDEPPTLCRCST